jgi:hypothetical protein
LADKERSLQEVLDDLYHTRALWVHWLKLPNSAKDSLHRDLAQIQGVIAAVEAVIERGDPEPPDPEEAFLKDK